MSRADMTAYERATSDLNHLEVGLGIAQDRGASRIQLELGSALEAIGWALLAIADEVANLREGGDQ